MLAVASVSVFAIAWGRGELHTLAVTICVLVLTGTGHTPLLFVGAFVGTVLRSHSKRYVRLLSSPVSGIKALSTCNASFTEDAS